MKTRILSALLAFLMIFSVFSMSACDYIDFSGIVGEKGEPGEPGQDGIDGENGKDGKDGVDGEDGKDGTDGITPLLRINEETNYWEVSYDNGLTWTSMGVKATGEDGKDGENGKDGVYGEDGKDGIDGENGKDGITPQIRINSETAEWEVSYDNGKTWTGLGYFAEAKKNTGFEGLKISILGDSISTYTNASNGTAATITNSTIKNGAIYYTPGKLGVYQGDTWWQQTADALGGSILVNNSWSGSCVFSTKSGTAGAYVDRCVQLHDDTGMNAGEEPDIIVIFLGTNDCSYDNKSFGDYGDIDFSNLIKKDGEGYVYTTPTTVAEAYAVMLHKMQVRYPDTEIYCMTPCQRINQNEISTANLVKFCSIVEKIATRFGAYTVDLYNDSGIFGTADSFETYMPDNRVHPGVAGMDAITNTLLSVIYEKSRYTPNEKSVFNVSYDTDAVILEGRKYATLEGEPFSCTVKERNGYELDISVFMNGEEITESACKGNKILVEKVTGNITVKANYKKITRDPLNFRFETVNNKLVSVTTDGNTENTIIQNQGTIINGLYTNAHFTLGTNIELLHDRSWAIEWKVSGVVNTLLFSEKNTSSGNNTGNRYLFIDDTGFAAMGEFKSSNYHNYICKYDSDYRSEFHIYQIKNIVFEDGSNMIYLYIDGNEIGALNDYYIGGDSKQNQTVDWVNGKDFYFSYLGTKDHHTISNCYLEYIQVWEEIE